MKLIQRFSHEAGAVVSMKVRGLWKEKVHLCEKKYDTFRAVALYVKTASGYVTICSKQIKKQKLFEKSTQNAPKLQKTEHQR